MSITGSNRRQMSLDVGMGDDDLFAAVGRRARELREVAGLHQSDVAKALGIGQPVISKYENVGPPLRYVFELCDLLAVSPATFFEPFDFGQAEPDDDLTELLAQAESLQARIRLLASRATRPAERRAAS